MTLIAQWTDPPDEGTLPRAWRELKKALTSWWFWLLEAAVGGLVGGAYAIAGDGSAPLLGLAGSAAALLLVGVGVLLRTPYWQRDQAREQREWMKEHH